MPKKITYTDETPFPFGKYAGKPMQEVPADYLIWCYDNNKLSKPLRKYVEENMDVLETELSENENL